jgi:ABC-type multidrug transport system ATPase subunit
MELGLADAADVVVGGAFRKGISGGEKRRLSIGCVLVTLPSILVLDEPTTGLDAFTAFALLETLKRLAERGRTVLLSIHQPRSDAFPVFDRIILLSVGSVVFSGRRDALLPHFASVGYAPQPHTNPLDFVIDVVGIDNRTDEAEEETSRRVGELVVAWREYESRNGVSVEGEKRRSDFGSAGDVEKADQVPSAQDDSTAEGARPGFSRQTVLLTRRGLLNVSRNPGLTLGFAVQSVVYVCMPLFPYRPPSSLSHSFFRTSFTLAAPSSLPPPY